MPAPVLYTSANQVGAIRAVRRQRDPGAGGGRSTTGRWPSAPVTADLAPVAPALFTAECQRSGAGGGAQSGRFLSMARAIRPRPAVTSSCMPPAPDRPIRPGRHGVPTGSDPSAPGAAGNGHGRRQAGDRAVRRRRAGPGGGRHRRSTSRFPTGLTAGAVEAVVQQGGASQPGRRYDCGSEIEMHYRKLGRTNFEVSDIGYGAWGIGGKQWLGGSDDESVAKRCGAPSIWAST